MAPIDYADELVIPTAANLAQWKVVPQAGGLPTLAGPCPGCGDDCRNSLEGDVITGGAPAAAVAPLQVEPIPRLIRCTCRKDHHPPPGVRGGCGRYWMGRVREVGPGVWTIETETDVSLYPALTLLDARQGDEDSRIQAAAEKWLAGITALVGLFSLTGVATAKDAMTGVDVGWKVVVAVLFVAALGTAARALYLGYTAAYGWPRVEVVETAEEIKAWKAEQDAFAKQSAGRLTLAVRLTFVVIALLALVAVTLWFVPRAPTIVLPWELLPAG